MAFTVDRVFPTEGDLGGGNKGAAFTDESWRALMAPTSLGLVGFGGVNFVLSGLDFNTSSGLDVTMNGGKAMIEGRYVEVSSTEDITLVDDSDNWIWLQLTPSSGPVTGVQLFATTSETVQERAVLLLYAVTATGSVSSTEDARPNVPWGCRRNYVGNGGTKRVFFGFQPDLVIAGATQLGAIIVYPVGLYFKKSGTSWDEAASGLSQKPIGFDAVGADLNANAATYHFAAFHAPEL